MSTPTHTKGPWHIGQGNGEGSIFCESGRMRLEGGGTTLYPVCDISRGWDEGEDHANARLIAAAPEMLEALRVTLHRAEQARHSSEQPGPILAEWLDGIIAEARAVIAKAEGRAGE